HLTGAITILPSLGAALVKSGRVTAALEVAPEFAGALRKTGRLAAALTLSPEGAVNLRKTCYATGGLSVMPELTATFSIPRKYIDFELGNLYDTSYEITLYTVEMDLL